MCAFKNNVDGKKICTKQCDNCKLKKYSTMFRDNISLNIEKVNNASLTKRQDLQPYSIG